MCRESSVLIKTRQEYQLLYMKAYEFFFE